MKNSNRSVVEQPEPIEIDPLSALLRSSARALIAQAGMLSLYFQVFIKRECFREQL